MHPNSATPTSIAERARLTGAARHCRRLLAGEGGIAAVEFALILPIMLVLWIGGVEVTQALSIDRRLNNLAAAVGDLVARDKRLEYADITAVFDIADAAMKPYATTKLAMRVTAVAIDAEGKATVSWSRASQESGSHAAYSDGADMSSFVPETLRVADSQVIMSQVYYTYRPTVGYVLTNDIELDDTLYFAPRLTPEVTLCDDAGENCRPD